MWFIVDFNYGRYLSFLLIVIADNTVLYCLCGQYLVYCLFVELILSTWQNKNPLLWLKNLLTSIPSNRIYRFFLIRSSSWPHIQLECFLCKNSGFWPDFNIPYCICCTHKLHLGSTYRSDPELPKLNSRFYYPSYCRPDL